jgi:hypothetical protein
MNAVLAAHYITKLASLMRLLMPILMPYANRARRSCIPCDPSTLARFAILTLPDLLPRQFAMLRGPHPERPDSVGGSINSWATILLIWCHCSYRCHPWRVNNQYADVSHSPRIVVKRALPAIGRIHPGARSARMSRNFATKIP